MQVKQSNGLSIRLSNHPVGRGGEGVIYLIPEYPKLLGKVYHHAKFIHQEKLRCMIAAITGIK